MATHAKNRNFKDFLEDQLIPTNVLDDVCEWANDNLSPDTVFNETNLKSWAENNGFVSREEFERAEREIDELKESKSELQALLTEAEEEARRAAERAEALEEENKELVSELRHMERENRNY